MGSQSFLDTWSRWACLTNSMNLGHKERVRLMALFLVVSSYDMLQALVELSMRSAAQAEAWLMVRSRSLREGELKKSLHKVTNMCLTSLAVK